MRTSQLQLGGYSGKKVFVNGAEKSYKLIILREVEGKLSWREEDES